MFRLFAFTFMFYQLKWKVKLVSSRQFGLSAQIDLFWFRILIFLQCLGFLLLHLCFTSWNGKSDSSQADTASTSMLSSAKPLAFHHVQSAQIDLFWFRILVFLQCSAFLPSHLCFTSWNGKSNSSQAGSSGRVWRKRKQPAWSGKTQRVFHSIRTSKLLIFTTRKWVICVV